MNITAIVPSLNPDEKLMQVVQGLLDVGFTDIILVNDGSDEAHLEPFETAAKLPQVTVLTHEVNKGKGRAMKTAFQWCLENRPNIDGVVTADGDNQHRSEDILRCAQAVTEQNDKVWLGVRDFSLEHVPARSRFGNTLTRNIMRIFGGVSVTDTQTGLRAIPYKCLPFMLTVDGERYEYETEQLMALHDNGWEIGEVVIETVYIDENQTSHFHPIRDSWKIYKLIFRHAFRKLGQLIRFSASSLFSVLVDQGVFALLNAYLLSGMETGKRQLIGTLSGRVISSVVNYSCNKRLVFKTQSSKGSLLRYFTLCAVQTAASFALLRGLTALFGTEGLQDNLVKMAVDTLLFFISYRFQKRWVFADSKDKK